VRPSRIILGLLLAYQALFLNVLLPGHTRGAITLDGKHTAPCCCCGGGADRPAGKGPAVPSQRDRDHCAICQFAAGITSVPMLYLKLAEAGLVERLPPPRPSGWDGSNRATAGRARSNLPFPTRIRVLPTLERAFTGAGPSADTEAGASCRPLVQRASSCSG
jgi:hypothetical protein